MQRSLLMMFCALRGNAVRDYRKIRFRHDAWKQLFYISDGKMSVLPCLHSLKHNSEGSFPPWNLRGTTTGQMRLYSPLLLGCVRQSQEMQPTILRTTFLPLPARTTQCDHSSCSTSCRVSKRLANFNLFKGKLWLTHVYVLCDTWNCTLQEADDKHLLVVINASLPHCPIPQQCGLLEPVQPGGERPAASMLPYPNKHSTQTLQ